MTSKTLNYGFTKPGPDDAASAAPINDNFDIADAMLKSIETDISDLTEDHNEYKKSNDKVVGEHAESISKNEKDIKSLQDSRPYNDENTKTKITAIWTGTRAQLDALTRNSNVLYIVTGD